MTTRYALVPLEPTEAMMLAASELDANSHDERVEIWRRMLAAERAEQVNLSPVCAERAIAPKPLVWSDPQPPTQAFSYDRVTAETPFGQIMITWKGHKEFPVYCIERSPFRGNQENFGFLQGGCTLEETKRIAETEYARRIAMACDGSVVRGLHA